MPSMRELRASRRTDNATVLQELRHPPPSPLPWLVAAVGVVITGAILRRVA